MTNYNAHSIDARDLTSRLNSLEQTHNTNNNNIHYGDIDQSSSPLMQQQRPNKRRPRSTSPSSASTRLSLSHLPRFSKSSTISTTDSGLRGEPSRSIFRDSVEIGPGGFSKGRVPERSQRRQRSTTPPHKEEESSGGEREYPEFRPYGRHSNQWLFNDFSISDALAKGVKRIVRGRAGSEGDWYEKREK